MNDNVPMQYDFRSIYATILEKWFCLDKTTVDSLFPPNVNTLLQSLPLIKAGVCTGVAPPPPPPPADRVKVLYNYPQPFNNDTEIYFKTNGGHTLLQVFDTMGRVVANLLEKDYTGPAQDKIKFEASSLPTGIYYARLQNGVTQNVWPMLKVR